MQNAPGDSIMPQVDFRTKKKVLPPKRFFGAQAGCGDVTSLYKNLVKNTKLNFYRQPIQEPAFSVSNTTEFEDGCDGRAVAVIAFFWSSVPNPAIGRSPGRRVDIPGQKGGKIGFLVVLEALGGARGEIFVPPGFHGGSTRKFPGGQKPRVVKKCVFNVF
jgi:hypothetical protein